MISISEEMRIKHPFTTGFCEVINQALLENPNMSLAEFAEGVEEVHKEERRERLIEAEKRQFGVEE